MSSIRLKRLVLAAACLALALYLPFLTGQIPQIGAMISPMHIPVLICGFICGPEYGAAVGFIAPLLRYPLFGMPPIFPTGVSMAVELAVYGLLTGLLYRLLPKKPLYVYVALVVSMLAGRVVWGVVRVVLLGVASVPFSFEAFIAGAFVNAWVGIVVHILIIPPIVLALRRARLMVNA
jgi:riboflavin transporter FmnP